MLFGVDEGNMEDAAGPSTRHETTQGEEDAARKTLGVEYNNIVMTFFFRVEGPKKNRKKNKSKVANVPVARDDTFEKLLGKKCDVEFLFRGINYSIGSHANILTEKSFVFLAMPLRGTEANPARVLNEQMRPEIFKEVLFYIYTGKLSTPLNEGVVQPLYILAVKYRIEKLEEECIRYMCRILKEHNVVKIFAFFLSHTFPDAAVKKMTGMCERFIVKYRYRMARYCMGKAWDKVVASCTTFQ